MRDERHEIYEIFSAEQNRYVHYEHSPFAVEGETMRQRRMAQGTEAELFCEALVRAVDEICFANDIGMRGAAKAHYSVCGPIQYVAVRLLFLQLRGAEAKAVNSSFGSLCYYPGSKFRVPHRHLA